MYNIVDGVEKVDTEKVFSCGTGVRGHLVKWTDGRFSMDKLKISHSAMLAHLWRKTVFAVAGAKMEADRCPPPPSNFANIDEASLLTGLFLCTARSRGHPRLALAYSTFPALCKDPLCRKEWDGCIPVPGAQWSGSLALFLPPLGSLKEPGRGRAMWEGSRGGILLTRCSKDQNTAILPGCLALSTAQTHEGKQEMPSALGLLPACFPFSVLIQ